MEHEIKGHAVKAYKVWKNPSLRFWHKLREISIEVGIIVFAVSLSIWLHGVSEHRHQQKEVKTFLIGLKEDLKRDINDVQAIKKSYDRYRLIYTYLNNLDEKVKPNLDSLNSIIPNINGNNFLRVHKSRFNGYLSAGKILNIEDADLSAQILNYYQETTSALGSSEGGWIARNNQLNTYIQDNIKDNTTMAYWKVLVTPKAKYLTKALIPWQQLLERYDNVESEAKKIITQIDKVIN